MTAHRSQAMSLLQETLIPLSARDEWGALSTAFRTPLPTRGQLSRDVI